MARRDAGRLARTETPLLCHSIMRCPTRSLVTLVPGNLKRACSGKRVLASGTRQIWTCLTRENLTTPMTRQSGCGHLCQTAAGENPTSTALLQAQASKRTLAPHLSSFPKALFPATHVYQYLQMFHPQPSPLTPFSPSSPVFQYPQLLPSPVSADPSLSPSSCVSRTPIG